MSALRPLSFPEDKNLKANPAINPAANPVINPTLNPALIPASKFPYGSISGDPHQGGQSASDLPDRMQQLETMLQEAQGRAEIIEKEAYDKAYLAGEKAGMALGKKRGEQILETLQSSLQDAEHELAVIRHAFAEAAMDVAGFIAEQIVADALESDHERLWAIVQQAATRLPDVADLRIAVSPDDYGTFKRLLETESSMTALSSDVSVESGTCRIISNQQDMLIDPASAVQACLEQLRPALLKTVEADSRADHSDGDQH